MKHLFIINPAAGKYDHTKEYAQTVERVLRKYDLEYELALSTEPGDCEVIARRAAETGEALRIYACGGDGTLNEVVCGAAGFENVAITHFPGGSGNDFIKIFSETEPFHHLERLLDCDETRVDLIRCNGRYSVNILSMGLDARVGTEIAKYKRLPLVSGSGAYAMSLVVNLMKGLSQPMTVVLDGETVARGQQTLVCICNGRWYGGGYNPVPTAEPDDGLLDVLVVDKLSLANVSSLLKKYQQGRWQECGGKIRHFRCRSAEILCEKESVVNVDGEALYTKRAEIAVVPKALRFFYPKGLTYSAEKFTVAT